MDVTYIASRAFLAIVGGIGNILLLVTLKRDKKLRARLSSLISVIMGAQSVVDAIFCLVGVPMIVVNEAIREEGVTSLGLWFCYVANVSSWRLLKMSFWMLLTLAATRFAAVYMPLLYRRYASSTAVSIAAVAIPIVMSMAAFTYGMITNWIRVKPIPGRGICFPIVVNKIHTSVSFSQLEVLFTSTAVPFALLLYLLVWTRLFWQRLRTTKVAPSVGGGASVAAPSEVNTLASGTAKSLRKLQQDRIRLMTLVFAVNFVLILPNQLVFFLGLKPWVVKSAPLAGVFMEWLLFLAIAINPLVYAAMSGEIRAAFKRTLTLT